jgi:hypothetical protein
MDVLLACADGVQQGTRRGKTFRSYLRGNAPVFDATHWAAMPAAPFDTDEEQLPMALRAIPSAARRSETLP